MFWLKLKAQELSLRSVAYPSPTKQTPLWWGTLGHTPR